MKTANPRRSHPRFGDAPKLGFFVARYQKAGYTVLAPSWPGLEGEVEAIRRDTSPLKGLKMKAVVDHYERIIRKLDNLPILMGHSLGGIVVQLLVDRGLASAAVPIAPGQPAGVPVLPFSTVERVSRCGLLHFNGDPPLSPTRVIYAFPQSAGTGVSHREGLRSVCIRPLHAFSGTPR